MGSVHGGVSISQTSDKINEMQFHLKRFFINVKCGKFSCVQMTTGGLKNMDDNKHINHIRSSLINNGILLMYDKAFNIASNPGLNPNEFPVNVSSDSH